MSYILSNTGNPLGRRNLGWDNAPYSVYRQPRSMTRLNGEFTSAGADQGTNGHRQGSITYRIDPRTGQYNFYRTDIKPRGVFVQNTFQHPAPDTVTALGARVLPAGRSVTGSTLQQGRVSRGPMIALRPGITLSGLGCGSCGGRCNSPRRLGMRGLRGMRGLGADECSLDTDCGPGGACAAGVCVTQEIPVISPNVSIPQFPLVPVPPDPTGLVAAGGIAQGIQQIVQTATGPRVVTQPAPSWFNQSSSIGGGAIPNSFLAVGAALFAALAMHGSKGRR